MQTKEAMKAELLKRKSADSIASLRASCLKWAGASFLCWLALGLAINHLLNVPSVSVRVIDGFVAVIFTGGGVSAAVIAYLRLQDWRFLRHSLGLPILVD
jgi:hypothetical protein